MKAWGWISMRRSLGDALKNAFEETTMKNVPINQFQSFKWRNRVQNRNLREKLSKIGPLENFNFWLKVNAKVKQKKVQSQWLATVRVGSRFSGSGHGSDCRVLDIILMMWHWLGLRLVWLMTWHACVSMTWTKWCQYDIIRVFGMWRRLSARGGETKFWRRMRVCMRTYKG